jgi:hypothetical protein
VDPVNLGAREKPEASPQRADSIPLPQEGLKEEQTVEL